MLLVEMIASRGKTLATMLDELMAAPDVGPFRYARNDQAVAPFSKAELVANLMGALPAELASVTLDYASDRDGVKYVLVDSSWLLIRPSGTEPVLRVYAEARTEEQVQALLALGGELANAQITRMNEGRAVSAD